MVRLFGRFARLVHRVVWAFEVVSEVALVGLLGLVAHEVFVRYVLDSPTLFSVEISEYLLVLVTFLSAAWVLRQEHHVRIVFCVNRLPRSARRWLDIAMSLLLVAFCAILVWRGGEMTLIAYLGDDRSSSLVAFPLWIPYGFIPLGGLLVAAQCLVRIGETVQALRAR